MRLACWIPGSLAPQVSARPGDHLYHVLVSEYFERVSDAINRRSTCLVESLTHNGDAVQSEDLHFRMRMRDASITTTLPDCSASEMAGRLASNSRSRFSGMCCVPRLNRIREG
jgi:hypothetical protein